MSTVIASPQTYAPAVQDRDAADHLHDDRRPRPSKLWVLLEALAYAGAAIDPAAALAARRFARVRDEELRGRH
jgi:hypothetical protein